MYATSINALVMLLLTSPLAVAEMQVQRDIRYCESSDQSHQLDVYSPGSGKHHPIVVWIHGGGWTKGDKQSVQKKPQAFTDRGFVFISTNYRFVPKVTVQEMTADVAKAIRWAHDHAEEIGGDSGSIYVMGHSAGAHLAALVCTDDRYLKAEGLSLSVIKGCVPVDSAAYDIPKRIRESGPRVPMETIFNIFGNSLDSHKDLSPVSHTAMGKSIPPFLILHVADRRESKSQSQWLAEKLTQAKVWAKVVAAEGKTHGTINSELGHPDDKPTQELFEFLQVDHRLPSIHRDE